MESHKDLAADKAKELMSSLKWWRRFRGLSQTAIARSMGTVQSAVSEWESLAVQPGIATTIELARLVGLGIKLDTPPESVYTNRNFQYPDPGQLKVERIESTELGRSIAAADLF